MAIRSAEFMSLISGVETDRYSRITDFTKERDKLPQEENKGNIETNSPQDQFILVDQTSLKYYKSLLG